MKPKPTTYRTYFFAGSLFAEEETAEIKGRDVALARKEAPEFALGFSFYDQTSVKIRGETLFGEMRNESRFYKLRKPKKGK